MIEVTFFFPNSDGRGSWSFSLLPMIKAFYLADKKAKAIQFGWLFWGFNIIMYPYESK